MASNNGDQSLRSRRANAGIPPERYGEWEVGSAVPSGEGVSVQSHNAPSKRSSLRQRREADILVQEELLRLEQEQQRHEKERRDQERAEDLRIMLREQELILAKKRLAELSDNDDKVFNNVELHISENGNGRLKYVEEWARKVRHGVASSQSVTSRASSAKSCCDGAVQRLATIMEKLVVGSTKSAINDKYLARQIHGKDLPTFTGKCEEFVPFMSVYQLTTKSCDYDDVANLHRLQRCLRGDALAYVQSLMGNPNNVPKILKRLEMRFGQPRFVIESLIQKIRDNPCVKEDGLDSLISFGTAVDALTTTLESLKDTMYLQSPLLLGELETKLPIPMQLSWRLWCRADSKRECNLRGFSVWLEEQMEAACLLCQPSSFGVEKDVKKVVFRDHQKKKPEPLCVSAKTEKTKEKSCSYCGMKNHTIVNCFKFKKLSVDDKYEVLREKRCCFSCLLLNHSSQNCKLKKKCGVDGCDKNHHQMLHSMSSNEVKEAVVHVCVDVPPKSQILYQVLEVFAKDPKGEKKIHVTLDSYSGFTMMDSRLVEELGLSSVKRPIHFTGVGSSVNVHNSEVVDLQIKSMANGNEFLLNGVQTYKDLSETLPCRTLRKSSLKKWCHLRGLPLPTYNNAKIMMIIGQPHANLIVPFRRVDGPRGSPVAAETPLGWVVCGNLPETIELPRSEPLLFLDGDFRDDDLHQLVKSSFSTEFFGVKVTCEKVRSREDQKAENMMKILTRRVGDRWETGLLWRSQDIRIPESKTMAQNRLICQERRMDRDAVFAKKYCQKIEEYLMKGYLRKLTPQEAEVMTPKTFYLPHFGTMNPNKPKLRLVFDAAAKTRGVSLNSLLLTGPDLLNPLPAVLFKFREKRYGITADIRERYHQVLMREEDCPSQRLLWRGMNRLNLPDTYEMTVMMFGTVCSPSRAQFVKNLNAEGFRKDYPVAVDAIIKRFYMDDYLDSLDTEGEAIQRQQQVFEILRKGGFHLCSWTSNSQLVMDNLEEELKSESRKDMRSSEDPVERVLGLHWNAADDTFRFKLNFHRVSADVVSGLRVPTKREALGLVMSLFDPLGFIGNHTVKAKILLQDAWRSNIGWDDPLPATTHDSWFSWLQDLKEIEKFRLPRCYSTAFSKSPCVELHIFCDASESAFAAIAYFRVKSEDGYEVSFVASKTRVAPLKPLSIPRMELQAALMGSRLAKTIKDEHERAVSKTWFWSDSKTVIQWLRSNGCRHLQFVAHRVGEIQELTDIQDWLWIPSNENVADEATRNVKPSNWNTSSRWLNGPEFLKKPETEWPKETFKQLSNDESNMTAEYLMAIHVEEPLFQVKNYSLWIKMVHVVAWVKRFVRCLKLKVKIFGPLEVFELQDAEVYWFKIAQRESFTEEIEALSSNRSLNKTSKLLQLCPFVDNDGLLKVKGRIHDADVPRVMKFPVILDPGHDVTRKIIDYYHNAANHIGQERVVNEIRQKYYVPHLRAAVRSSWSRCQFCKNARAQPIAPQMGRLPISRLQQYTAPFTETGIDYFGPLDVTVGRRREKRYGAIFTCLTTRAVHVELAHSLTTDSCIMAIRRFISRRGCPITIHSDNGTNFRGADVELKKSLLEIDQKKVKDKMAQKGITWKFIPPSSPHMGGSWESQVKAIKKALYATLKELAPREEVLLTLLAEAEHTVNSRPLTYVAIEPGNSEALTPNHFLIGRSSNVQPAGVFTKEDMTPRKMWRYSQRLADSFWKRWISEYLRTLTRRTRWFHLSDPLLENDVVLIIDGDLPRNKYPKGIITKTYPGKDGIVRVVDVKTSTGTCRRPVIKLAKLDVKRDAG